MNIYDFLISQDIADHCQSIGHTFNSVEMAVIIARSRKTLREKHEAYRHIISTYPDMSLTNIISTNFRYGKLHEFLHALILWEEKAVAEFMKSQVNCRPLYSITSGSLDLIGVLDSELCDDNLIRNAYNDKNSFAADFVRKIKPKNDDLHLKTIVEHLEKRILLDAQMHQNNHPLCNAYPTVQELLSDARKYWDSKLVARIRIKKQKLNSLNKQFVEFGYDGNVLKYDESSSSSAYSKNYPGYLERSFLHLPVPFKTGDVVIGNDNPFFHTSIPYVVADLQDDEAGTYAVVYTIDEKYRLEKRNLQVNHIMHCKNEISTAELAVYQAIGHCLQNHTSITDIQFMLAEVKQYFYDADSLTDGFSVHNPLLRAICEL